MNWKYIQPFHSRNKAGGPGRPGTTIVELMMVVVLMTLLATAIFYIFSGGRKGAHEALENQYLNEDAQRIVDFITNDVREANILNAKQPQQVFPDEVAALKTLGETEEEGKNTLNLKKVVFDFKVDPNTLPAGKNYYTQVGIRYFVKKDPGAPATAPWVLYRTEEPLDDLGQPIGGGAKRTSKIMSENLTDFLFYRLKPKPGEAIGAGSSNIYCKFRVARKDKDPAGPRYKNEVTTGIKVRGCPPP